MGAESGAFRTLNQQSLASTERHDAKKCFGCEGNSLYLLQNLEIFILFVRFPALTAHPLQTEDGDLYTMAMSLSLTALKMNILRIPGKKSGAKSTKDAMKKGKIWCTLPNRRNGAVGSPHSFGMTKNYFIVVEHPHFISMSKVLSSLVKGTTINEWFEWHPHDKVAFYVIEKATGKILKTEYISDGPFYFMHFINCYEDGDQVSTSFSIANFFNELTEIILQIVVDLNCYDSPAIIDTMQLAKLRAGETELADHPYACRYVLPLVETQEVEENVNLVTIKASSRAVRRGEQIVLTPEVISETRGAELPALNQKYLGKKYGFYYMAGTYNPSAYSHSLCKVNVDKKEVKVWKENDFNYPSEPLFIPNPNGIDEDDGTIVSTVTDTRPEAPDFLLYLNAKTMTEIGRAYFVNRIPTGLHGTFLPAS